MPNGFMPSEGQWQKLALGRALMRPSPVLRVLDEPTASLDAESEEEVFGNYLREGRELGAVNGSITLLVSHRFATVRAADLIVTVSDGKVVQTGTHEQLMAGDGWYARVCKMQAEGYV